MCYISSTSELDGERYIHNSSILWWNDMELGGYIDDTIGHLSLLYQEIPIIGCFGEFTHSNICLTLHGIFSMQVTAPFRTQHHQNHQNHSSHLTISYIRLNLWLLLLQHLYITIHYKLHLGSSGGLIQVHIPPPMVYIHLFYLQAPQSSLSI